MLLGHNYFNNNAEITLSRIKELFFVVKREVYEVNRIFKMFFNDKTLLNGHLGKKYKT
jgi:hypothetical protein